MGVTNAGLAHALASEFTGGSIVTTWYLGLINNSPTPTLASSDTLASHAGWAESNAYSGNRPAWNNGAVSNNATANASSVNFAMNATLTVFGMFVCSVSSGTSGTLWCTAAFAGGVQGVNNGDTLQCTYTVSASSS